MSLITIFVILLAVVFAVVAYFTQPSDADKRTRERLVELGRRPFEESDEGILKVVTFSQIALVDRWLRSSSWARQLSLMLEQAKLPWTVGIFCLSSVLLSAVGGALGNTWLSVGPVGWLGVLIGLAPFMWVLYRRSVRMNLFNTLLPQAVDLIARGLQAGYSLSGAMLMVAEELSDPIGPEFRRAADEVNFGLPFREALLKLADRYPIEDVQFLVTAVLVQSESGGNLVELLQKLAVVLRARIQLKQKVRVFTAQGRLTGMILVAMPFVLFVIMNIVNPGYSKPMLENETGRQIIYGTLVSMAAGVLVIRRIVNIRV